MPPCSCPIAVISSIPSSQQIWQWLRYIWMPMSHRIKKIRYTLDVHNNSQFGPPYLGLGLGLGVGKLFSYCLPTAIDRLFCPDSRFSNWIEPSFNRLIKPPFNLPINRTYIKLNDVVLVKTKRFDLFFYPLKKSKQNRFITHVNRFNRNNSTIAFRQKSVNRLNRLLNWYPTLFKVFE
jgi:hypothetical protein